MEQSLISWLMNGCEDFWNEDYESYMMYNEQGQELPDRLISLLANYSDSGFEYDVTTEQVFDSCGLNIYTISIAAATFEEGKKPEVECIVFTAKVF